MSVECPICFQKFDSFRGLNGHMNRHRPKRLRAESSNMDCPICGETCSQVSNTDYECSTCETLWTKMQGDGFTYLEAEEEKEYYIRYRPKFAMGYLLKGPFSNLEKAQDEARLMSLFKQKHRGVLGIQEGKTYPPNYVLTKSFCKMCGADSENPCVCMIGPEVKPCTNKVLKKWKSDAIAHFPCPCSIEMEKNAEAEEDILVPFFEGQVIMLNCPLCSYATPPIQVGSGFCEDCGEMVSAFELTHYCLENHPESVRDIIEDDIDAYNEAEFWLLESHADFCPAIQSGAFTVEDIEDNL